MAANKNSEFYSVAANKIVSLRGDKSFLFVSVKRFVCLGELESHVLYFR